MAPNGRQEGQGDVGRPAVDRPESERRKQEFEAPPPDSAADVGSETRPEDTRAHEPGPRRDAPPPDLHRQTVDERANRPVWIWVVLGVALVLVLAWVFLLPG